MHDFKTCACAVIAVVTLGIAAPPDDPAVAAGEPPAKRQPSRPEDPPEDGRFDGRKALVLEPENFWGWDAAIFGALQERHFDVTYARAEALEDFGSLSRYDLVASDIKRSFTPAQVANLRKYVAEGGALYGSWGGPMGTGDLLRQVCHVGEARSVRIAGMILDENTPLSKEYLVYAPRGGELTVNLLAASGTLNVEWMRPADGASTRAEPVAGGGQRTLKAPFEGDAVLYLWASAPPPATLIPGSSGLEDPDCYNHISSHCREIRPILETSNSASRADPAPRR